MVEFKEKWTGKNWLLLHLWYLYKQKNNNSRGHISQIKNIVKKCLLIFDIYTAKKLGVQLGISTVWNQN